VSLLCCCVGTPYLPSWTSLRLARCAVVVVVVVAAAVAAATAVAAVAAAE
jgi:hypothetical protein